MILFSGCDKKNDKSVVLASVNDKKLTEKELKSLFSEEEWKNKDNKEKKRLVNEWIDLTVLAVRADQTGLSDTDYLKTKLDYGNKRIKANALIAQKTEDMKVNENEIFDYYKLNKSKYKKEDIELKLQRIYVSDKNNLEVVKQAISEGITFKEAAKLYSEERAGASGGFIGWKSRKNFSSQNWEKLKSAKKLHYIVMNAKRGFYMTRWYDKRTVKTQAEFLDVKDEIKKVLISEKKAEVYNNILKDAKENSEIIIQI